MRPDEALSAFRGALGADRSLVFESDVRRAGYGWLMDQFAEAKPRPVRRGRHDWTQGKSKDKGLRRCTPWD